MFFIERNVKSNNAVMDFQDLTKKAKEVATGAKESAKKVAAEKGLIDDEEIDKMDEATSVGTDKIKKVFEEISAKSDILKEAGYILDGIAVSLGIPPKITAQLLYHNEISEEKEEELLERTKDDKLLNMVLKSLFKATALEDSIDTAEFKIKSVNIQLGLIPAVTLNFAKA